MNVRIGHYSRSVPATIGTSTATSTTLRVGDTAGGAVIVSGITATATVTVYGSPDDATFSPVYGFDGTLATMTLAADGGAVALPDAVYPLRFVKLVSDTGLGTAASVVVSFKS